MKSDLLNVSIKPGQHGSLLVDATTTKCDVRLSWSRRLERFSKTKSLVTIRRGSPSAYRALVAHMEQFCSEMQQSAHTEEGTRKTMIGTKVEENGTNDAGTLPRARAGTLRVESRLSRGTHSKGTGTQERDRDSAPAFGSRTVPIPQAPPSRTEAHKAHLAKDPRFAAWVTAKPEKPYVLLWSHRQNGLHIEPAERMLSSNRQAYREDRPCDYVVIWQGTMAECEATAANMHGTLEARARARQADPSRARVSEATP